jgi:hypothetical protein
MSLEKVTLIGGQVIYAHSRKECLRYWCAIHYTSPHHMVVWPQNWREDIKIMERICPHGVGHPDPDEIKAMDQYESVHGCDGCCKRPFDLEAEVLD